MWIARPVWQCYMWRCAQFALLSKYEKWQTTGWLFVDLSLDTPLNYQLAAWYNNSHKYIAIIQWSVNIYRIIYEWIHGGGGGWCCLSGSTGEGGGGAVWVDPRGGGVWCCLSGSTGGGGWCCLSGSTGGGGVMLFEWIHGGGVMLSEWIHGGGGGCDAVWVDPRGGGGVMLFEWIHGGGGGWCCLSGSTGEGGGAVWVDALYLDHDPVICSPVPYL